MRLPWPLRCRYSAFSGRFCACCLTVVTVWQWLQNFDLVPPGNGVFGAACFWFVGLGVGALYNQLTADHGED